MKLLFFRCATITVSFDSFIGIGFCSLHCSNLLVFVVLLALFTIFVSISLGVSSSNQSVFSLYFFIASSMYLKWVCLIYTISIRRTLSAVYNRVVSVQRIAHHTCFDEFVLWWVFRVVGCQMAFVASLRIWTVTLIRTIGFDFFR